MIHIREKLIEVFEDTGEYCKEDKTLAAAVDYGRRHARLYEADDYPELPVLGTEESLWLMADDTNGSISAQAAALQMIEAIKAGAPNDPVVHKQEIRVSRDKTFQAAMKLHKEFPDKKIAVLNFASATNPGGAVKRGSRAQEESLCRCSTLYPSLDQRRLWEKYYEVNRKKGDALNTDACIYTPEVLICKTDEDIPVRIPPEEFVKVDVITCAAPNLRYMPEDIQDPASGKLVRMEPLKLYELHLKRARHILHIAAYNKADILVSGAFGCGAFANDPEVVAKAWHAALAGYRARFDLIEFAIYCRDYEMENYEAFRKNLCR